MSSRPLGTNSSGPEVTNVSSHGLWLLAGDKELFVSYEDFPWSKDVPIGKILNVQEPTPGHFYWPDLDVDLGVETIEHPDRFPLKAKSRITTSSSADIAIGAPQLSADVMWVRPK